eukprot:5482121-Pleurochrysis_carterae.AAC.1
MRERAHEALRRRPPFQGREKNPAKTCIPHTSTKTATEKRDPNDQVSVVSHRRSLLNLGQPWRGGGCRCSGLALQPARGRARARRRLRRARSRPRARRSAPAT